MLYLNKPSTVSFHLGLSFIAVAAGLIVWALPDSHESAARRPKFKQWSITELLGHLKESGVDLRVVSTRQDGEIHKSVFLTSTDRNWHDLNLLPKSSERIDLWNQTLYCECCPENADLSVQADLWGENCLIVEPFVFFGDRRLLERVQAALDSPLASDL
jgi:hypothetical protein